MTDGKNRGQKPNGKSKKASRIIPMWNRVKTAAKLAA